MGLRSHIMEVLRPEDIDRERRGIELNGIMHFPKAVPVKIMRLFRAKFHCLEEALLEVKRVKLVEKYLAPDFIAQSEEFLVHYALGQKLELLLCGLQVYVKGQALDPWSPVTTLPFKDLLLRMLSHSNVKDYDLESLACKAKLQMEEFIERIKKMIIDSGHIPDLAGVGNILLTPSGQTVLVDINNISKIVLSNKIYLDDRGYPVCDKSIQALYFLEKKVTGKDPDRTESVYQIFMSEDRLREVHKLESKYHQVGNI